MDKPSRVKPAPEITLEEWIAASQSCCAGPPDDDDPPCPIAKVPPPANDEPTPSREE